MPRLLWKPHAAPVWRGSEMERITAVIFDMDGLMFDTEQLYERTWGQAVEEQGGVFTREIHSRMMGRSKVDSAQILLEAYGPDFPVQKVIERQTPLFFEALKTEQIPAKKGLFSLLDELDARGLKKAVASSSRREKIDFLLMKHKLQHRFDCVVSGQQVHNSKPNPEIFLLAAEQLGEPPAHVLVLEDSNAGIRAAHNGGFRSVLVPDLCELEPDVLALCLKKVDSLEEVAAVIDGINRP